MEMQWNWQSLQVGGPCPDFRGSPCQKLQHRSLLDRQLQKKRLGRVRDRSSVNTNGFKQAAWSKPSCSINKIIIYLISDGNYILFQSRLVWKGQKTPLCIISIMPMTFCGPCKKIPFPWDGQYNSLGLSKKLLFYSSEFSNKCPSLV